MAVVVQRNAPVVPVVDAVPTIDRHDILLVATDTHPGDSYHGLVSSDVDDAR